MKLRVAGPMASAMTDEEASCLVCEKPCPKPRKTIVAYHDDDALWHLAGYIHLGCDLAAD